tara:strand:- start:1385 stop:4921 length:3537 start_codon:yes stop_codon:yes gene_type:complete
MNFKTIAVVALMSLSSLAFANVITGKIAYSAIKGANEIRYTEQSAAPSFISFKADERPTSGSFNQVMKAVFKNSPETSFKLIKSTVDEIGYTHNTYQQFFKEVKVEHATYVSHEKNGLIESISGFGLFLEDFSTSVSVAEQDALSNVLNFIGATTYKWQVFEEEQHIKMIMDDQSASYYPKGEQVIIANNAEYEKADYRLAWKFNVYAHEPMSRNEYYIDAKTKEVIFVNAQIHTGNVTGTAVTAYSGTQTITTDSISSSMYRLRNTERGNGIVTLDCNTGTSYGAALDFTDTDNLWNNVNADRDEYATDAHWGAEQTWDYFFNVHNRNSIDGNGFALYSYVHYDQNYANAFWDGQRMTYGDGNPSSVLNSPLTALDIAGHEIAHGLTSNTANLIYQRESGALNESFSDIFGTAIEFYARPTNADWLIGDDLGNSIRSMVNPNAYGDPDTYGGTSWRNPNCGAPTQGNDYCGVHSNSGVQNYWFYLLSEGGSGTNDLNNAFTVNGLGIDTASKIAFRNLTVYLSQNSTFADARFYSIRSAVDLYGPCSPQVESVTNAWYAVGVGQPYIPGVGAEFTSTDTSSCIAPYRVRFQNNSNNAVNYSWDFGDGTSSTQNSPLKTYTTIGNFDVTLIADGGACGIDTLLKVGYISVDTANLCNTVLTNGINTTQTSCLGKLFDSGGSSGDYEDNFNGTITIAPSGAASVRLDFVNFDVEPGQGNSCNYDYMEVFDGPSVNSPSLGIFCNNNIPTSISSTKSSITVRFISDVNTTGTGFEIDWTCMMPTSAPTTNFYVNSDTSCSGIVQFFDYSANGPSSWVWDFGDGTSSTLQNPNKVYTSNGVYNVKLVTSNGFGADSLVQNNLVSVRRPRVTTFSGDTACPSKAAVLSVGGSGSVNWYDAASGGNLVGSGNPFTAPLVTNTVTYYAEAYDKSGVIAGGAPDNTIGGGGAFNGDQHLNFSALKAFNLKSVVVYAASTGNRTIQLRNSNGAILQSKVVNIPTGTQRVTLDFDVPVGTNYQLGVALGSSPDLFRNNSGAQYPYNNGIVNITSSSAQSVPLDFYYFFYDWEVEEVCKFSRIPVTATFDPNCTTTSIGENGQSVSINLVPNPTKSQLTINLELLNATQSTLVIMNVNGQVVKEVSTGVLPSGPSTFMINVDDLTQGIYFVNFRSDVINKVTKLIVMD